MNPQDALVRRLSQVEPARASLRASERKQAVFFVSIFLVGIPLLLGGTVGVLWLMGNFVSQHGLALSAATLTFWAVLGFAFYQFMEKFRTMSGKEEEDYHREFRDYVLLPSLRDVLPGCRVSSSADWSVGDFDESKLFHPNHNRRHEACAFEGTIDGFSFRGSVLRIGFRRHGRPMYAGSFSSQTRRGIHFAGILIRLNHAPALPGIVRLVDRAYERSPIGYETARWPRAVRVSAGEASFDHEFLFIIDQELASTPPPAPEPLRRACFQLKALYDRPVFLSFTPEASYLAVHTGDSRLPMEVEYNMKDPASVLGQELDLLRRIPQAVEILHRGVSGVSG